MEGRTYEGWKGLKAAGANVRWTFWPDTNSRAVIPEVFGDAHAAAWVQFFRNLPAVDEYMVISASTKAAGTPAPGEVDEVVGIAGKNPNDISGESIMQWLFRQHL